MPGNKKMKKFFFALIAMTMTLTSTTGIASAEDREIEISVTPEPAIAGSSLQVICEASGDWHKDRIKTAKVILWNSSREKLINLALMTIHEKTATYDYEIPADESAGSWKVKCIVRDGKNREKKALRFTVIAPVVLDADGDGFTKNDGDCNDNDASIHPGADEICGDSIDQDCNGSDLECVPNPNDVDNDGDGFSENEGDCNDDNVSIHPGADEICGDGIDQDCNGSDLECVPIPDTGHLSIQSYEGPATCIACHTEAANEMLGSVHMKWSGPTPELSNTNGEELGKAVDGINTFCTYAMSSKGACFSCHVRSDGNAGHEPDANDVDCLMCHNDVYQRKFISDPNSTETVTNILGETKTYMFGKVDAGGNYLTEPDFNKMPADTTMVDIAQNVHLPTRQSCLRCHAKAGGGDWTKRGDMGLSSANPNLAEDVHMSADGADLSCSNCHSAGNHLIGGRGIDLRATEAPDPECTNCHTAAPHSSSTTNRHATGQASCQLCHIQEFAKGGATEMSRDWSEPHWNQAFCNGQGGFVGHEVKFSNVKPEYRWFDGTSYVYNIGETIEPNPDGTYTMAKANGAAFDGDSKIYPIKNHWTNMPLHESDKIIPPEIMQMFMTGDFDQAVQKGMEEQGMTGNYAMVNANAEMLITHGVEPKSEAPSCNECHDGSGQSNLTLPFAELGYHNFPERVESCTLCHEQENMEWESMHNEHVRSEDRLDCTMCHTSPPTGFVKPKSDLCNDCHSPKSEYNVSKVHKKHLEKGYTCTRCHNF